MLSNVLSSVRILAENGPGTGFLGSHFFSNSDAGSDDIAGENMNNQEFILMVWRSNSNQIVPVYDVKILALY